MFGKKPIMSVDEMINRIRQYRKIMEDMPGRIPDSVLRRSEIETGASLAFLTNFMVMAEKVLIEMRDVVESQPAFKREMSDKLYTIGNYAENVSRYMNR